jgi:FkbM family methyltransferase
VNYTPQSEYYRYVWARMAREHPEFTHDHDLFGDPGPVSTLLLDNYIGFTPFPGARVMDIGANVGILTAYWALNGALVTAYEADHCTARLLSAMLESNGLENVDVVNAAIWKVDGELPFVGRSYVGLARLGSIPGRNGAIQVPDAGDRSLDAPRVPCVAFASALGDTRWDAVKMDIEGAEFETLAATPDSALALIRHMHIEFHNGWATDEQHAALMLKLAKTFEIEEGYHDPRTGRVEWARLRNREAQR